MANGQCFHQSRLWNEASTKTLEDRFGLMCASRESNGLQCLEGGQNVARAQCTPASFAFYLW